MSAIVRLDNMSGTTNPTKLVSARYFDGSAYAAIQNGSVLKLDSLISGEKEVWKAVAPAANDTFGKLILVASPEVIYDATKTNLSDFTNAAGANVRGYVIESGDIFSVTSEAVTGTPDVTTNKYITVVADTKLATATVATDARFDVVAVETVGTKTFYVLRAI